MNILVIGGSNIDIYGQIPGPTKMKDSNPGKIYQSFGGVGRNILENLARLGLKPRFVTSIGDDKNGRDLLNNLSDLGVETKAQIVPGHITPTYLAVLDSDHDLLVAVNDMDALSFLTVRYLKENTTISQWIKQADIIVADTNLDATVLGYLINEAKKPIFIDTISTTKALKLVPYLNRISALKCSRREAESLSGEVVCNSTTLEKIGSSLIAKGIGELYLTDGANGSYLFKGKQISHQRALPAEVKSTSGAGDAFFAGVIYGKFVGGDPLKYGSAAAKITLESPLTNSVEMTAENLARLVAEINNNY